MGPRRGARRRAGALAWGWFEAGWLRKRVLEVDSNARRRISTASASRISRISISASRAGADARPKRPWPGSSSDGRTSSSSPVTSSPGATGCSCSSGCSDSCRAASSSWATTTSRTAAIRSRSGSTGTARPARRRHAPLRRGDRDRGSRSPDRGSRSTNLRAVRGPSRRARRRDCRPPNPPLSFPGCRAACS